LPTQANLPGHLQHSLLQGGKPGTHFKQDNLDWADVARLREQWPGKFILKGILHPDDARRAAQIGADAIVVSNHGARSLDHAIAPITALPDIVTAAGGRLEIILDSGIKRGSDIVKAMALGADATMVGRATLYGMAAAGEAGADRAIALLAEETRRTLAYLGHTAMRTIDKDVLYLARDQQSG